MAVILETSLGDITVDLYTEERPRCCTNFLKLCKVKYYNFCIFHSVQRNLVAQTGDPTGTGRGGESVYGMVYGDQANYFDAEVNPRIKHKQVGLVSMVNNGSNMHGSQFFMTMGEDLDYLDGVHTVFGEVSEGMDILMKINETYCDAHHQPYKDIRIYHTIILDDPFDDPPGLQIPDRSPLPTKEQLKTDRIGAEEEIDDFKGMAEVEIQEIMNEKEAKANAQILTMIGDLPSEEVKPEDNVLFVCKLNPVTTDEDLEIIFSRFGTIKSCEVIRDHKTKESLQYAFIEFEKEEQCENAYFKMDNVLIDDRRIHVDFSQSVAKVKWKGKGKGVEYPKARDKETKEDSWQNRYAIKDQSKKNDNYDLVFEGNDSSAVKEKKKKKKHKKDKSSSESDRDSRDRKKKYTRNSSSPEQSREKYKQEKMRKYRVFSDERKGRKDKSCSDSDSDGRGRRRKHARYSSSPEQSRGKYNNGKTKKYRESSEEKERKKHKKKSKSRNKDSSEERSYYKHEDAKQKYKKDNKDYRKKNEHYGDKSEERSRKHQKYGEERKRRN